MCMTEQCYQGRSVSLREGKAFNIFFIIKNFCWNINIFPDMTGCFYSKAIVITVN